MLFRRFKKSSTSFFLQFFKLRTNSNENLLARKRSLFFFNLYRWRIPDLMSLRLVIYRHTLLDNHPKCLILMFQFQQFLTINLSSNTVYLKLCFSKICQNWPFLEFLINFFFTQNVTVHQDLICLAILEGGQNSYVMGCGTVTKVTYLSFGAKRLHFWRKKIMQGWRTLSNLGASLFSKKSRLLGQL